MRAMPTHSLRFIPPESILLGTFRFSTKPTSAIICVTTCAIWLVGTFCHAFSVRGSLVIHEHTDHLKRSKHAQVLGDGELRKQYVVLRAHTKIPPDHCHIICSISASVDDGVVE
jgi:hypothetical protein